MTITRRAVTVDTTPIRNSLFAGAVASATTYATMAAPQPFAACAAVGGAAALVVFVWRTWESDRRAFETRERDEVQPAAPEPQPARPFVPSANGNTTRIANIRLSLQAWQRLIDDAARNGWTISRNRVREARIMPREYYNDWDKTIGAMERAGMVERQGNQTRLTERGLTAIAAMGVTLPRVHLEPRPPHRAGGRRAGGSGE